MPPSSANQYTRPRIGSRHSAIKNNPANIINPKEYTSAIELCTHTVRVNPNNSTIPAAKNRCW